MERDARFLILRVAALAFWVACVAFLVVPSHAARAHFQAPGAPQQMPVGARAN